MEELSIMERLNKKIEELGAKIDYLKSENSRLGDENTSLKNSLVEKDMTITKLKDESGMKELEIEDVIKKLEDILNR